MAITSGYKFPILDSSGNPTSTIVDMADMFIRKELFLTSSLYASGNNSYGQLGISSTTNVSFPVQVGSLTNWKQVSINKTGYDGTKFRYGSLAIKTDGTLWYWGNGYYAQDGLLQGQSLTNTPPSTGILSPVQIGTASNWKQVEINYLNAAAIDTKGQIYFWGYNSSGEFALLSGFYTNSGVGYYSLGPTASTHPLLKTFSLGGGWFHGITIEGYLFTSGSNNNGQLGLGDTTNRTGATQVGALNNWKQISSGYIGNVLAIKTDGTLWAWGYNTYGQLGLNDIVSRSSPVQVGSLSNWKQVSAGDYSGFAIKNDGTLWAWGNNGSGQLGIGDTTNRSSPVQVGSLTNWKQVSGGDFNVQAIKTDGTLWAWGYNLGGQLGLGDTINRSSPVQVGSLTNWKQTSICEASFIGISSSDL
jgi:alpha-tubulin suppressor-like RCC1 family protein